MLDHLGITVTDYARSKAFYAAALEPLGYRLVMEPREGVVGFGFDSPYGAKPALWLYGAEQTRRPVSGPAHVALEARDRAAVDAFHAAALAAGATDNGAPGLREIYHPTYYAAFVLDFDGNNLEAVCHRPA